MSMVGGMQGCDWKADYHPADRINELEARVKELEAALEEICWSRPLGFRESKYSRAVENISKAALKKEKP